MCVKVIFVQPVVHARQTYLHHFSYECVFPLFLLSSEKMPGPSTHENEEKSITNCICGCCHSTFNVCLPALPFFPSVSNLLNLFSFSMLEPANCRTYPLSGSAGFFLFLSSPLLKIGNSLTVVVAFGEASVAVLKKKSKKSEGNLVVWT